MKDWDYITKLHVGHLTSLGIIHIICDFSWVRTLIILYWSSGTETLSFKRQYNGHNPGARQTKIGQKLSPAQDKLLEIENSDKYDRYITKRIAAGGNKCLIVSIRWFYLYHIMLGIISNIDVFDSKKLSLWFLIGTRSPLKVEPGYLKKKNNKYKLKMTVSKRIRGKVSMTYFQ